MSSADSAVKRFGAKMALPQQMMLDLVRDPINIWVGEKYANFPKQDCTARTSE